MSFAEVIVRSIQNMTTILGSLALTWTLVLVSPGVRVVRAEEGAPQGGAVEVVEGESCEAGSENDGYALADSLEHTQRAVIDQLAASLKLHDPGSDYVDLNNRGFNQPTGR